jgi:hypothetical protein
MFLVTKNTKKNTVAVYAIDQKADLDRFNTDERIPQEIAGWPVANANDLAKTSLSNADLLNLYNATREEPLVKFQNKQSAMERAFGVFPTLAHPISELLPPTQKEIDDAKKAIKTAKDASKAFKDAKKAGKSTDDASKAAKKVHESNRQKGKIDLEAQSKTYPCREGTKQALLIDSLAKGATIQELLAACGKQSGGKVSWTETSVRSGIYWDVNKVKGYGIRTEFDTDGTPRYFLVYPKGQDAPVPHKARTGA